jgi:hypothetical protein
MSPERWTPLFVFCFFIVLTCSSWAKGDNKEWIERKSPHFLVYYKNTPEDFVKEVVDSAEGYYTDITKDLGFSRYKEWTWSNRAKIFIYDNADQFNQASSFGWAAGEVDALTRRIITYPSNAGFFDSVLPHELTHIILREFVGPGINIPLWFDEGAAMYGEKARRVDADNKVRVVLENNEWLSVQWLESVELGPDTDRAVVEVFYTASASLFGFLIKELEPYRFLRLCSELKKGTRFEWALAKAFMRFKKTEDLQREWMRYLGYGDKR